MDKTAVFLRIRALTHALDTIFSNADEALSEDANTISMMLVELVDEYDRERQNNGERQKSGGISPRSSYFPAHCSRLNRSLMLCRFSFPARASRASCGL